MNTTPTKYHLIFSPREESREDKVDSLKECLKSSNLIIENESEYGIIALGLTTQNTLWKNLVSIGGDYFGMILLIENESLSSMYWHPKNLMDYEGASSLQHRSRMDTLKETLLGILQLERDPSL